MTAHTLARWAMPVAAAQPLAAAAAVIAVLAATGVVGACAALALGGTTGDVYGAVGKAAELAAVVTYYDRQAAAARLAGLRTSP